MNHQPDYRLRKRRENGVFQIVCTDESGKTRRRSTKTRDEVAARRQIAELVLSGDTRPPADPTIGYVVET